MAIESTNIFIIIRMQNIKEEPYIDSLVYQTVSSSKRNQVRTKEHKWQSQISIYCSISIEILDLFIYLF